MDAKEFVALCKKEVVDFENNFLFPSEKKSDDITTVTEDDVVIVWLSKILQNNKALVTTKYLDGTYYEVTYNGDKCEYYIDVYKKIDNYTVKI